MVRRFASAPSRNVPFVLFELIAARYERRSMLITANQPFKQWDNVFPDPAMSAAGIDLLVHHSVIFEMNVESYRQRTAQGRKAKPAPLSAGFGQVPEAH